MQKLTNMIWEDKKLGDNLPERVSLVKKYIADLPKSVYLKYRLMELYHNADFGYAIKKIDKMRALCRYIADHTTDNDYFRYWAIGYMIDVEEDDKVGEWYLLLE